MSKMSFMNMDETYNAEFSLDILDECMEEMLENKSFEDGVSKEVYLHNRINEKLIECNKKFEESFDKDIENLKNIIDEGNYSVKDLNKFMKRLSRVTTYSCNTHMTLVKSLLREVSKNGKK